MSCDSVYEPTTYTKEEQSTKENGIVHRFIPFFGEVCPHRILNLIVHSTVVNYLNSI